jgi:hypothetical protein
MDYRYQVLKIFPNRLMYLFPLKILNSNFYICKFEL